MKLFGKKINIGKTISDIGKGIVKGVSAVTSVVAPVVKTIFPASAGVVDKVTGFLDKASDKIKIAQNVVKTNPLVSGLVEKAKEALSGGNSSSNSVSGGDSGGVDSDNTAIKRSTQDDSADDEDKPQSEFEIRIGKFPKLILIGLGIWKLTSR